MRYYHILPLALILLLGSCKQYEDMPSGNDYPTLSISKDAQAVSEVLRSSQYGWSLILVPSTGNYGGLNLHLKFVSTTDVVIASEEYGEYTTVPEDPNNPSSGTKQIYQTEFTSNYHFSQNEGVRLTFDTYSKPLHYYSNPYWGLPNGYGGDTEFIVKGISEDKNTIYLVGGRTGNQMQLTRLPQEQGDYLEKTQEIKTKLKAKSFSPLQLGGKEVSISVFGYARQLWVRYPLGADKEGKEQTFDENLPFYYTDKGLKLITPLEIGGEKLEGFELSEDSKTVKTLDGKQTLNVSSGQYDLTNLFLRAYYYENATSKSAYEMFQTVADIQRNDTYPAQMYLEVYWGNWADDPLPRVTLWTERESNTNPQPYYLDYTTVYGKPNQIHLTRIIQNGLAYFYTRRAIEWYLENILYYSPYSIESFAGKRADKRMISVDHAGNDGFWFEVAV